MNEQLLTDTLARLDRRLRRFPLGTCCGDCGEPNRLVLCACRKRVVCYECRLAARGLARTEKHHIGGRPGELTIDIPANLHRLLTLLQELWRGVLKPGAREAILFDLHLLRVLGPSYGVWV